MGQDVNRRGKEEEASYHLQERSAVGRMFINITLHVCIVSCCFWGVKEKEVNMC